MNKVCLIIPAYNEASVLNDVIKNVDEVFKKSGYEYSIVVIDDGSKDNTASVARSAGAEVISHILNTGSGGATATGLSYAQQNGYEVAATLDADGQHDARDVLVGVQLLTEHSHDLLIGSRLINKDGMSRVKVLGNRGLSFITFLLFGTNVTDSQSGLRIFSKRALNELRWKSSGYEFCSEMLWRAKQLGLAINEYPIKAIYTEYSRSKGQNNWNAFNIIKVLLRRRIVELFGE
ncbi:MAG TPA: glycosyltransferase family 2 protein [Candidatus Saccharimonadales bacterium]|nr:glycosyltransferase family 2 protein [Candidatus Saccharimonadales bacterium]